MGSLLHMSAKDLFVNFQFTTIFANHLTITNIEEWFPINFQCEQFGKVILTAFRRTKSKECSVAHLKDRKNDFEKELGIDVGSLINDDHVRTFLYRFQYFKRIGLRIPVPRVVCLNKNISYKKQKIPSKGFNVCHEILRLLQIYTRGNNR